MDTGRGKVALAADGSRARAGRTSGALNGGRRKGIRFGRPIQFREGRGGMSRGQAWAGCKVRAGVRAAVQPPFHRGSA
jgi:hypothetical protein